MTGISNIMAMGITIPLHIGLVSYWKLDEASGQRNDSHGSNHLTDNNTVGSTTGIINSGANFVAANSEYLSCASNASLQMSGNTDWTITAWVKLSSLPAAGADYQIVTKDDDAANSRDYTLDYQKGVANGFRVYIKGGGTWLAQVGSEASTGVWYFLTAWYDSAIGNLKLRINDTTTYTSPASGATGTDVSSAQFRIGAREYSGFEGFWDGVIDEVGIWKRKLTSGEITQLYNGGAGLSYPF
jgi:hypothetical protein